MRVFVTGATGFVGTALVQELIQSGHQVLGLARSHASAQSLEAAGATVHQGTLEDIDSLRRGAAASDGVIHTAFIHDFANFAASAETDRLAVEAIGAELAGSGRPFVITSGIGMLAPGRVGTEEDEGDPGAHASPRVLTENKALSLGAMIVRLPPSVHGDGDHGFIPLIIAAARAKGFSAYIGEGLNRWTAVHKRDAARVYRLAIEKGTAGSKYHAIGDAGVRSREIAETIGRRLNLQVRSITPEEAAPHFGFLGHFFGRDVLATALRTHEQLGWSPKEIGLIEDLENGTYFG